MTSQDGAGIISVCRSSLAALLGSNREIDPASVRPRLAEAAAEGLDGIRKTLLDAATGAVRDHWITFECSDCGKRKRDCRLSESRCGHLSLRQTVALPEGLV